MGLPQPRIADKEEPPAFRREIFRIAAAETIDVPHDRPRDHAGSSVHLGGVVIEIEGVKAAQLQIGDLVQFL